MSCMLPMLQCALWGRDSKSCVNVPVSMCRMIGCGSKGGFSVEPRRDESGGRAGVFNEVSVPADRNLVLES